MVDFNPERIVIDPIVLQWSDWHSWMSVAFDSSSDIHKASLPKLPGVYDVKYVDSEERLTIGKASNLRSRVRQALVLGKLPHSSGSRIRLLEDTSKIVIRWAITERPSAVEEELHRQYRLAFGKLPKYTLRT